MSTIHTRFYKKMIQFHGTYDFGFRIYEQWELESLKQYQREDLIKIKKVNHHEEHSFVRVILTEKGQMVLDMGKL